MASPLHHPFLVPRMVCWTWNYCGYRRLFIIVYSHYSSNFFDILEFVTENWEHVRRLECIGMRQCNCSSSIMLYLGHGLPKYEVKVETMLVFTGAHVKLGLATVLGETPWLFNMDQPKCLRGQNMSEHLRTQSFPRH